MWTAGVMAAMMVETKADVKVVTMGASMVASTAVKMADVLAEKTVALRVELKAATMVEMMVVRKADVRVVWKVEKMGSSRAD